jgi:ubiquinone/menaquinone biosynthesis C-methylase UbiE
MSGFRRLAFTARTSRLCACTKVIALCRALAELPALTIVDLACGTGSMLRALASHLPALQNGKLVDNDLDLLVRAADVFHSRPE